MFKQHLLTALIAGLLAAGFLPADDVKSEARVLFGGKSLDGWQNAAGKAPNPGWVVDDGAMVRKGGSAGDIWTKERFGDFILDLEFQTTGNSGVFIRTDKPTDNVQTGLEIQIHRPAWFFPDKHSCGALYDALAPTKEASKNGWNHLMIIARGPQITVVMNNETIVAADLDRWTEPGKNPDGTKNKFNTALKDFKREGHIGLQDHGDVVKFRNIKIQPIGASKKGTSH